MSGRAFAGFDRVFFRHEKKMKGLWNTTKRKQQKKESEREGKAAGG